MCSSNDIFHIKNHIIKIIIIFMIITMESKAVF